MTIYEESLKFHEKFKGKIEVNSRVQVNSMEDLSLAYTPGVAEACRKIHDNPEDAYKYTRKGNLIAVISDGTAVLGLGDIGPAAAMPVMEGKCVLFKTFADIDAFPIVIDTKDPDELVETIARIAPSFGGINLEDISAPRCFEVETRLKAMLDIPVFHDDQHGTAVVVLAGLMNALKLVNKKFEDLNIVMNGAGAAGVAIAKLLLSVGAGDIVMCDRKGAISKKRTDLNSSKLEIAEITNKSFKMGSLADVIKGADVIIGVSSPGSVTVDMIKSMGKDPIVFALANPTPEIFPEEALSAGARIMATGRSDYPNQVNNVLVFPGIFRGALDVRAGSINEEMKLAAARAIAGCVGDRLSENFIIPKPFEKEVTLKVTEAVKKAAIETKVARI